jgi:hypothetical protein
MSDLVQRIKTSLEPILDLADPLGLVSRLSRARPLVERHGTGNASRI